MAPKASNDDFKLLAEEQRSILKECIELLKQAQELIERGLDRERPKPK